MLNKEQKKAIEEITKPLLVIAGPGTGKTNTIVEKIDYLIKEKGMMPDEILALTFTDKAALEMSKRVELVSGEVFCAKTFHSFALEIIEEYEKKIPQIDRDFTLINEAESLLFFYENLDEFKLSSIEVQNNRIQLAYDMVSSISKMKDYGITLKELERLDMKIQQKMDLLTIYSKYEQFKKKKNYLDFGDLLLLLLECLRKEDQILEELRERYKYILIDEFQDTNKVQFEIATLLCKEGNIMAVGDQKQSIYGFRGANYGNFELFTAAFPDYEEIVLHQTYRPSQKIMEGINLLIKDQGREEEILTRGSDSEGELVLGVCKDESSQEAFILSKLLEFKKRGKDKKTAILCRKKSELLSISRFLKENGISHHVINSSGLFKQEIVKEIMMILKIVLSPKEANVEIFKVLGTLPLRKETIRRISRKASLREKSIYNVLCETIESVSEFKDECKVVEDFCSRLLGLIALRDSKVHIFKLVHEVVIEFSFYQRVHFSGDMDSLNAVNDFVRFSKRYSEIYDDDLERFLGVCEMSELLDITYSESEIEVSSDITLMTLHQSKGLEFDNVFIPFLNERRFPSTFRSSFFDLPFAQDRNGFLEEEKRLFFVGVSRAKENLYLCNVEKFSENKGFSKPSPLLRPLEIFEKQRFEKNIYSDLLSSSDLIKQEILQRIRQAVFENKFEMAKNDVELLSQLFEKSNDLRNFMEKKHPDYETYKKRLVSPEKEALMINPSDFVYSVSQLQMYDTCPRKYLYGYIYKIPTPSRHYFDFGTTIHTVFELLIPDLEAGMDKVMAYAKGVELLRKHWISKAYESVSQEKDYFELALKSISSFIEKDISLREEERKTLKREERFNIDLDGKKVIGVIDRVDELGSGLEVIDYKTSNSMENEDSLKDNIQLYVYAQAVKKQMGKYPEKISLWYTTHDKIVSVPFQDLNAEGIDTKIKGLIDQIESGNFAPKPTFFACKFCDFNRICDKANK